MLKRILTAKINAKQNAQDKKSRGFTIIELIVVMAVIAILILIAIPTFTKYMKEAEKTREMANASTIYKAAVNSVLEDYTLPEDKRAEIIALLEFSEFENVSNGKYNIQDEIIRGIDGELPVTNKSRGVLVFGSDNNYEPLSNISAITAEHYQGTWRVFLQVPDSATNVREPGHVIPTANIYILSPDNNWYLNGEFYLSENGQK